MTQKDIKALAAALERHRLDQGWSYDRLGEAMSLPQRTVHVFCTRPPKRPHKTTLHAIQKFLEAAA